MTNLTDDNWGVGCHLCHCCGDADHRHGEILSKWVDRAVAAEADVAILTALRDDILAIRPTRQELRAENERLRTTDTALRGAAESLVEWDTTLLQATTRGAFSAAFKGRAQSIQQLANTLASVKETTDE